MEYVSRSGGGGRDKGSGTIGRDRTSRADGVSSAAPYAIDRQVG